MKYKYVVKNAAKKHGKVVDLHAQAALSGQRHRHARAYARSGRTASTCSPARGYAGPLRHGPATRSAACSSTPRPSAPSPIRPPTATSGSCPATKRRSTSPTAGAIARRRSAFPMYSPSPKAKRIEFRCPDPSSNPYLVFAAMLMAMLDGIKNKIKPGEPLDKDIYDLEPEELAKVPQDARLAGRSARRPGTRPRIPAARRRLHRRRHQHLDLIQAQEGSRRHPPTAASV